MIRMVGVDGHITSPAVVSRLIVADKRYDAHYALPTRHAWHTKKREEPGSSRFFMLLDHRGLDPWNRHFHALNACWRWHVPSGAPLGNSNHIVIR